MKEIKRRAEKERQRILEEDTFLEDVLLPMVAEESNNKRIIQRKRIRKAAIITAPLLTVIIIISVVLGILLTPDDTYLGQPVTKTSDLATLNRCLINTKITTELDLITATYNDETLVYHLFEANKEIMTEEALIYFSMTVLIDRDFPYAVGAMYTDAIDFLGFLMEVTENVTETLYEGIPVNEFTAKAFFDTGKECFYISYREITTNDESGFAEFLSKTIIKKSKGDQQ